MLTDAECKNATCAPEKNRARLACVSDGPKAHKNGGQARFLDSRLESCLILQGK